MMNLLMNSMLNLMILLILHITWVKSMINLKLLGRSLTEDFRPKVIAITESKDVDSIPIDELVGSLQSYELDLPKTSKSKSMALKSVDDVEVGGFDDELSATEIAYLTNNFRNFLRNSNRRARGTNTAEPRNFRKNDPTKVNNNEKSREKVGQSFNNSMGP